MRTSHPWSPWCCAPRTASTRAMSGIGTCSEKPTAACSIGRSLRIESWSLPYDGGADLRDVARPGCPRQAAFTQLVLCHPVATPTRNRPASAGTPRHLTARPSGPEPRDSVPETCSRPRRAASFFRTINRRVRIPPGRSTQLRGNARPVHFRRRCHAVLRVQGAQPHAAGHEG
jgi:hypothetical protein